MVIMTDPGTDKQIDELSKRVDFGFEQTNQRLGRVEDDVRELRAEMKGGFDRVADEFTAVRAEMKAGFDAVADEFTVVRGEMKEGFDAVDDEFTVVRAEVKEGFDGMQRLMTRFFAGTLGSIIAGVIVLVASHS